MRRTQLFFVSLLAAVVISVNLYAGPPLVCRGVNVPDGQSLPWGKEPFDKDKNYNPANVVQDTLELLKPEMPVLTRMETLRRASLYVDRDRQRAESLLGKLMARALDSEAAGKPEALAYFDAGYLTGCYHQTGTAVSFGPGITKGEGATSIPGYIWLARALTLNPNHAEMELAAALLTADSRCPERELHLQRAFAAGIPSNSQTESVLQWLAQIHGTTLEGLRAKHQVADARNGR